MYEIQLTHTFDSGHRIVGHKGKCARLHGHTYRAELCIGSGVLVEPGFVVDFGDVKDLIDQWDHRMLLWEKDSLLPGRAVATMLHSERPVWDSDEEVGIVRLTFNPTAENMAKDLAQRILNEFGVEFVHLTLWETPKACANVTVTRDA